MLPGITGMWQVSGRAEADFELYRRLDLFYVDNWSLMHDLKIVAEDVPRRRDATRVEVTRTFSAHPRFAATGCIKNCRILLLYVFLAWVLLGAMMVGLLHAAKTLVRYCGSCRVRPRPSRRPAMPSSAPSGSAMLGRGLGSPEHAGAARSSAWPAPATYWSS